MADPPRFPEPQENSGTPPDRGAPNGKRRWPTVVGIIVAIGLVLLLVLLHLTGTIGPGIH